MKPVRFVFCHGFALSPAFWDPLRALFAEDDTQCMDRGYFTLTPCVGRYTDAYDYIGIGHSLGFSQLIRSNLPFKQLIGLNAFHSFLGVNSDLAHRRARELDRLEQQLRRAPHRGLKQFYQRAGLQALPIPGGNIQWPRLWADLRLLAQSVCMQTTTPVLILGAEDDTIVPVSLLGDNFSGHSQVTLEILPQGQHALGYVQTEVVYQRIMSFVHAN